MSMDGQSSKRRKFLSNIWSLYWAPENSIVENSKCLWGFDKASFCVTNGTILIKQKSKLSSVLDSTLPRTLTLTQCICYFGVFEYGQEVHRVLKGFLRCSWKIMEKAGGFPKRTANPLYQEVQVGVSHLPCVLEIELQVL